MRGNRKCETCVWYEDKREEFRDRFVRADGLCHWRMPPQLTGASWGSWSQKGPEGVSATEWCSCHQPRTEHLLENEPGRIIVKETPRIEEGEH